ncbi:MAG: DUF4417 domain-containing protein, partial [Eubacterium sp.]|nr:DUF4417 domain-containing protein [Eubacterium sp.]
MLPSLSCELIPIGIILKTGDDSITSYEYRNDPMFLRNQFKRVGMFKLPLVIKQEISLENVKLIGYDKVNQSDDYEKIVHFFLDDYRFESIYNNPEKKLETLRQYKAVLTPDFSMFVEMPIALQLFSTFKNRWVGAYLQAQGLNVIPTVRWGDLTSFNFCFDAIEKGSIVAVSTIGVKKEKSHFMLGYNEMLSRIKPSKVICYGKPFDEMKGDIIEVGYGETNNLSKSFIVKKTSISRLIPLYKGGGSASGESSGNPSPNDSIPKMNAEDFPSNVKDSYRKYEKCGWKGARNDQNPKTKGGRIFDNEPPKLPQYDSNGGKIQYREFDVNSRVPNKPR